MAITIDDIIIATIFLALFFARKKLDEAIKVVHRTIVSMKERRKS